MVDLERDGQAEEGFDGEKDGLPAGGDGASKFELAELPTCLADRQIQIVSKFGHMRRLLLTWIDGEIQVEGVEADDYPSSQALISQLQRPGLVAMARTWYQIRPDMTASRS